MAEATAESTSSDSPERSAVVSTFPQVRFAEIIAVAVWTLLADLLIYRSFGYSGPGLFFALTPVLFLVGCPGLVRGPASKLTIGLICVVAGRLIWMGSSWTLLSAVLLVVALSMSAAGFVPHVMEGFVLASRAAFDGAARLTRYALPRRKGTGPPSPGSVLAWTLPMIAAVVFGAIFVAANPDLLDWVSVKATLLSEYVQRWAENLSVWEIPFCVIALLIGAGLMRPGISLVSFDHIQPASQAASGSVRSDFYSAFRNTLLILIVLFGIYLTFEFITLWNREFPEGFYYAGYAHQGAAWLTFALALATAVLSLIFSGSMLADERLTRLRRLSWVWSAQNLLLAVAVYHRLMLYVGYNGMTRLRTVAFFGITLVVIGFVLVLFKIAGNRNFLWLIRSQLLAFVLAVIAYSVFPVDYVTTRYNVNAVLSGNPRPSVMIAVKPITDEGIFPLLSLSRCSDPKIRDGVNALLARRYQQIKADDESHLTEFQGSRELLRRRLQQYATEWAGLEDASIQSATIERFRSYAMQWY